MRLFDAFIKLAVEENMKTLERYKGYVKTLGMPLIYIKNRERIIEHIKTLTEDSFYSGKSYLNQEVIGAPKAKEDGLYFETEKGKYRVYTHQPLGLTPFDRPSVRLICTKIK
jgi:hypothetical protein